MLLHLSPFHLQSTLFPFKKGNRFEHLVVALNGPALLINSQLHFFDGDLGPFYILSRLLYLLIYFPLADQRDFLESVLEGGEFQVQPLEDGLVVPEFLLGDLLLAELSLQLMALAHGHILEWLNLPGHEPVEINQLLPQYIVLVLNLVGREETVVKLPGCAWKGQGGSVLGACECAADLSGGCYTFGSSKVREALYLSPRLPMPVDSILNKLNLILQGMGWWGSTAEIVIIMDFLRELVAGPKNRFKEFGYNLDLSYITPRVIAMAFPASGFEKLYRNSVDSIRDFLQNAHQNKYITINISGRDIEEQKLQNVRTYDWEDHKSPSFETLFLICREVAAFLAPDPDRIAVFHCNHGKGRTGTIICCFFLYLGLFQEPADAMKFYASRRFAAEGYGVTQPCQIKYIQYFNLLLCQSHLFPRIVYPHSFKFLGEFSFKEPYIKIYRKAGKQLVYNSKDEKESFGGSEASLSLMPKHKVALVGDILVEIKENKAIGTNLLISYSFNSAFLTNSNQLCAPLRELSPLGRQDLENFGPSFSLQMDLRPLCQCGEKRSAHGCSQCLGVMKGELGRWDLIQAVIKVVLLQKEKGDLLGKRPLASIRKNSPLILYLSQIKVLLQFHLLSYQFFLDGENLQNEFPCNHILQLIQMLSDIFWRKLKLEMRLVHVVEKSPHKKIKLDPISEEQLSIEKDVVEAWSQDNLELYQELLKNGMAEFICNRDFLFEFYRTLKFTHQKIEILDQSTERFKNLHTLHLSQNKINSVKHLPPHCKKLYIDFNQVSSFQLQRSHPLEFLSVSHNCLDDNSIKNIVSTFPELRCLNCSHNSVCSLKQFVTLLGSLHLLKILISFENPISMLSIYYSYITQHLLLSYFDGSKYIKEEPKVEEPPPPPPEKQVKEDKKQAKKNAKKGAKVEQKPPEEPPQVKEIPKPVKRELTAEDFTRVKMSVTISNLEEHSGTVFDASLFPSEVDPLLTQTCYWLKYELMGEVKEDKEHKLGFDASTSQNGEVRLDLRCTINKEFSINPENHLLFNQGLKVIVMQAEPRMNKDPDTLQLKPEISQGVPEMEQSVLGAIRIDFRTFHLQKEKSLSYKFKLFPRDAVESPLFYDPFQNESELISSQKDQFQESLRMEEEERLKKAQEEEQQQTQKKGKDQKKVDKKAGKKDGKQSAQVDKPRSEACPFPVFDRSYSVIENNKMFKGKELVCLKVAFE